MDLLRPRPTYYRANTDDPANPQDDFELASMYSKGDSKQDHITFQEYTSDYHLRADPNQTLLARPTKFTTKWSGWRAGSYSASLLALTSLVINLTAMVWLVRHPNADSNLVEVFRGNCDVVSRMDTWVHLAINVLSTLLLGGSNYCMQCLSAPTRPEINKAHSQGRFLDIGVPGFRNLGNIATHKTVMWWILGLSSVPLHLMYNSAFYSSLATNDYAVVVVTSDFLSGANATGDPNSYSYDGTSPTSKEIQEQVMSNTTHVFDHLDKLDCIKQYAVVLLQDRRNLILVSSNSSSTNSSVLYTHIEDFDDELNTETHNYSPFDWICTSDPNMQYKIDVPPDDKNGDAPPCDSYVDRVEGVADQWLPFNYQVDYCLAERTPQLCSFNGNIPIVAIVIVCNTVKVILMLLVAFRLAGNPLITIGDAVESFLDLPDKTTRGLCLLSRRNFEDSGYTTQLQTQSESNVWQIKDKYTKGIAKFKVIRWSQAASGGRWFMTVGLIVAALITVVGFLGGAINAIQGRGVTIWQLGFGTVHAAAVIQGWAIENIPSPSLQILASILIANLPQAILSFLYLNLNGLLTSMFLALEWSNFAKERKYLRVSTPKGKQRSTHFLQLPYKIAIPLMVVSGTLHWLVSQSVFLAVVASYDPNGTLYKATQVASCGFSPLAMLGVILLGIIVIVAAYVTGRRKYDSTMPLASSCSAAISASCHRPEWDADASTSAVQWGVIPGSEDENGVGHCSFTSGDVEPIVYGKRYAGLVRKRLTAVEENTHI